MGLLTLVMEYSMPLFTDVGPAVSQFRAMTSKSLSLSLLCMIPFLGITQPAIITAPSAQEYLGQFQYFRTWTDKRRLIVVHGKDADMDRMLQDAIYQYRCDLATRNINIERPSSMSGDILQGIRLKGVVRNFRPQTMVPDEAGSLEEEGGGGGGGLFGLGAGLSVPMDPGGFGAN
eukprot:TCALIF_07183-PA protein Name:"Protein of unknown function" AED:0.64 eAED:0.64 QI:0/0/0.33/0.33/1/0.66/3/0/174